MPESSTWSSPAASQGPISSRNVSANRSSGTLRMPRGAGAAIADGAVARRCGRHGTRWCPNRRRSLARSPQRTVARSLARPCPSAVPLRGTPAVRRKAVRCPGSRQATRCGPIRQWWPASAGGARRRAWSRRRAPAPRCAPRRHGPAPADPARRRAVPAAQRRRRRRRRR